MTIIYQVWHKIPKFGRLDFADKRQRGHFGEPDRRIGRSGDSQRALANWRATADEDGQYCFAVAL
jgi:hypothetical protein